MQSGVHHISPSDDIWNWEPTENSFVGTNRRGLEEQSFRIKYNLSIFLLVYDSKTNICIYSFFFFF